MSASVDVTVVVRLVTFAAALVLGMILLKVAVQRWRHRGSPRRDRSSSWLVSYVLLVAYVAAAQAHDGFNTRLSWVTGLGQAGVIYGAVVAARDVFVIRGPRRRARRATGDR